MKPESLTTKTLVLWLSLAIGLPSPALALRQTGLEENSAKPLLEQRLRSSSGLEERIVEFTNQRGEKIVAAVMKPAGRGPFPVAMVLHGVTGHKNEEYIRRLAERLTQAGYVTLRPDFRDNRRKGQNQADPEVNQSSGTLSDFSPNGMVEDVATLVEQIPQLVPEADLSKAVLVGHSFGGWAARRVAALKFQGDSRFSQLGVQAVVDLSGLIHPRGTLLRTLMETQSTETQRVNLSDAKKLLAQWERDGTFAPFEDQRYWPKELDQDSAVSDLGAIPWDIPYLYVVGDKDARVLSQDIEGEYGSVDYRGVSVSRPVGYFLNRLDERKSPPLVWPNLGHAYAGSQLSADAPPDVLDRTIDYILQQLPIPELGGRRQVLISRRFQAARRGDPTLNTESISFHYALKELLRNTLAERAFSELTNRDLVSQDEAVYNLMMYGDGGTVEVARIQQKGQRFSSLMIRATDQGAGIADPNLLLQQSIQAHLLYQEYRKNWMRSLQRPNGMGFVHLVGEPSRAILDSKGSRWEKVSAEELGDAWVLPYGPYHGARYRFARTGDSPVEAGTVWTLIYDWPEGVSGADPWKVPFGMVPTAGLEEKNLNELSETELRELLVTLPSPPVGTELDAIVSQLIQKRPFKSWGDLKKRVSGVGPGRVDALQKAGVRIIPPPKPAADTTLNPEIESILDALAAANPGRRQWAAGRMREKLLFPLGDGAEQLLLQGFDPLEASHPGARIPHLTQRLTVQKALLEKLQNIRIWGTAFFTRARTRNIRLVKIPEANAVINQWALVLPLYVNAAAFSAQSFAQYREQLVKISSQTKMDAPVGVVEERQQAIQSLLDESDKLLKGVEEVRNITQLFSLLDFEIPVGNQSKSAAGLEEGIADKTRDLVRRDWVLKPSEFDEFVFERDAGPTFFFQGENGYSMAHFHRESQLYVDVGIAVEFTLRDGRIDKIGRIFVEPAADHPWDALKQAGVYRPYVELDERVASAENLALWKEEIINWLRSKETQLQRISADPPKYVWASAVTPGAEGMHQFFPIHSFSAEGTIPVPYTGPLNGTVVYRRTLPAAGGLEENFRALASEAPHGVTPVLIGAGLEQRYPELKALAAVPRSPIILSRGGLEEDIAFLRSRGIQEFVFAGLEGQAASWKFAAAQNGMTLSRVITPGRQEFESFILTVLAEAAGLEESVLAEKRWFGDLLDAAAASAPAA